MSKITALGTGQEAAETTVSREHPAGPIDLVHLGQQALGDRGLEEEVLRLYAEMSQVYMARIETSTSVPILLEHLHTLKSAAAGIGAWGIRDLARQAEAEIRAGAPVNPEWIDDIAIAVAECVAFIERHVAELDADLGG